jgi:uncharacterized protein (DUF1800 family)
MMAAQPNVAASGSFRPSGSLDMLTALQSYRGSLNDRLAAHLLRRAGFGASPQDLAHYAAMNAGDAVESLVHFQNAALPAPPDDLHDQLAFGADAMGKQALEMAANKLQQQKLRSLQLWWLNRMLSSPAPLQEKMALYFHGHFTTAAIQKNVLIPLVFDQNQLFRANALGNLRELARSVSKDPAMLRYLDGAKNVAQDPNENYAREFMELFTLGVDRYSEQDVRESARAWTGLRYRPLMGTVVLDPRFHDDGVKTFLGQTGNFGPDDIVDIVFEQPQCARFFATSLLNTFVYNDPEPQLVDAVAALLRKNNFELAPVVSTIFRSNVFFSDRAYRALVKSPAEFVVGTYKALGLNEVDDRAVLAMRNMGQILFFPPNVSGWPHGQSWITSATLIARQNFVAQLANSQMLQQSSWLHSLPMKSREVASALVTTVLQGDAAPASLYQLDGYIGGAGTAALAALSPENYDERVSGGTYLAMSMPAYQLS